MLGCVRFFKIPPVQRLSFWVEKKVGARIMLLSYLAPEHTQAHSVSFLYVIS